MLSNIDNDGCEQYIEIMKSKKVEQWMQIDCYHTDTVRSGLRFYQQFDAHMLLHVHRH